MLRKILTGKIHRATVTRCDLDYVGSITIDEDLLDAAGIAPNECVLVADLTNGSRHETYVIVGERGSGVIGINGAATHLVDPGDRVIIMCFALLSDDELKSHRPSIVLVDDDNKIVQRI